MQLISPFRLLRLCIEALVSCGVLIHYQHLFAISFRPTLFSWPIQASSPVQGGSLVVLPALATACALAPCPLGTVAARQFRSRTTAGRIERRVHFTRVTSYWHGNAGAREIVGRADRRAPGEALGLGQ